VDVRGVRRELQDVLASAQWPARLVVVRALGDPQSSVALEDRADLLRRSLEGDPDADIREAAAWALASIPIPGVRETLARAGERERDENVRSSIVEAIENVRDE